ncbi:hypothetical protein L7F22_032649 [Adiantum nelumboides]|nr:hypothetical protein [Adiantum nelumboides]
MRAMERPCMLRPPKVAVVASMGGGEVESRAEVADKIGGVTELVGGKVGRLHDDGKLVGQAVEGEWELLRLVQAEGYAQVLARIAEIQAHQRAEWQDFKKALKEEYFLEDSQRVSFMKWIKQRNKGLSARELLREFEKRKATGKAGGGLVLHDSNGEVFMKKHVKLPDSMSNNEAEYDILLHGLQVCVSQKIWRLMVKGDALLILKQIPGIWACKNERLREKVQAIRRLFNQFEEVQLYHIPRKQNEVADLLAQKAVACDESEVQVILAVTTIKQPRYQGMESSALIVSYILEGQFPQSFTKAQKRRLMEKASSYLFLEGALYQRGKDQVCRRIPTVEEIPSILEGLHEEACGGHFAQELTAKKILLSRFGTPLEIVSYNGLGFRKGLLTEVCDEYHILHRDSTPYYPQSNGLVEKANEIIARIIQKMVKNKTKLWDDFLDGALWAYRTTYKEATDFTPFHLVYGQEALQPIELNIPTMGGLSPHLSIARMEAGGSLRVLQKQSHASKR